MGVNWWIWWMDLCRGGDGGGSTLGPQAQALQIGAKPQMYPTVETLWSFDS